LISETDAARIQNQLGQLALDAGRIDLDGFLELAEQAGSAQALAAGLDPKLVTGASAWAEMARLLKPFRDDAVARLTQIRAEVEDPDGVVAPEAACPSCGQRRMDELAINEDDSVLCSTCGRRYQLPGSEVAC
jgi:DNA-directed RNA polymerase subunit RPC12/RpoP